MKRSTFTLTFYLLLVLIDVNCKSIKSHDESMASDTLVINEASLFCEVNFSIHGIAFDSEELMYVGGDKKIYTITPDKEVKHFITLDDTTENTIIWSLRFGPDQALYVAAKDRVLKVSPNGDQTVLMKETFPGPAGVTDLRFDHNGDLYIVYDNMLAKCDSNYQKQIIIDGSQFVPPLEWLVGIEFSDHSKKLYLGDCRGKHAHIVPYLSDDYIDKSKSFPTNWGQYFTQDTSGNVYITSLGTEPTFPEFVMFTPDDRRVDIYANNRIPQYQKNHKKAMAWGKEGFNKHAIYCIIGNRIYEYDFNEITSSRRNIEEPFMKTYGGSGPDRGIHIIQTMDDNFVIVGNTMTEANKLDVYLIKCNSSGDTLWTRTYGGREDDNGWCVKETSDKGYIIAGFTESFDASMNDVLLLKTDENGKKQWHKTFGGPGDDIAWSIAISQDDEYTIAAQTNSFGNGELDAYLIRTDAFGDTLWTKTFGGPKVDRVFSVDLANDGSILLAGISYSYGAGDRDAYLLKTDRDGKLLWQNTYGGPGYDNAHSVLVNQKNDIILTGYGDYWGNAGKMDMFLKQISLKGEDIWTQTYGGVENDRAMTVFQTQDGGYILTGFTQSFGEGEWDVYVVKTGSKGDTLWTSTYGSPAPDFAYDIIQSRKGNYYITGWSHGPGHPEGDLLLIKSGHGLTNLKIPKPKLRNH